MKLLVTGASGFVGSGVLARLTNDARYSLVTAVRRGPSNLDLSSQPKIVTDLRANTDWTQALSSVQVVIHTAARVHVMSDSAGDPLSEYRNVNVEGTLNLARQATTANVKRFIFISSIKVNGELSMPGRPFAADDRPDPVDPYGISKWEAEVGLRQLAEDSGMEVVIIRPPLVYGPGVKANLQSMMRWISLGVPLPLGAIHNRRSLVALDNLIDLITTCIEHPASYN